MQIVNLVFIQHNVYAKLASQEILQFHVSNVSYDLDNIFQVSFVHFMLHLQKFNTNIILMHEFLQLDYQPNQCYLLDVMIMMNALCSMHVKTQNVQTHVPKGILVHQLQFVRLLIMNQNARVLMDLLVHHLQIVKGVSNSFRLSLQTSFGTKLFDQSILFNGMTIKTA